MYLNQPMAMTRTLPVLCVLLLSAGPVVAQTHRDVLHGPRPSPLFALGTAPAPPAMDPSTKVIPQTQWKLGLIVGGIFGGLALGYAGYELCHGDQEVQESCFAPAVGGMAIGAVIGGGVGALIGGQFKKREQTDSLATGH